MIYKIFSLVLILTTVIFTQVKNPEEILERVKLEFDKIEDYQVDVKIKVDVDLLKMPDREATTGMCCVLFTPSFCSTFFDPLHEHEYATHDA